MPQAVPVLASIGTAAVGSSAAAGMSAGALATVGAVTTASAVGSVASGVSGIINATKDGNSTPVAFDQAKANKKASAFASSSIRRMAQQQTQTLLTSPLGVAQTLLGS